MKSKNFLGLEGLSIKQIIEILSNSDKYKSISKEEITSYLLDRRPIELILLLKEQN